MRSFALTTSFGVALLLALPASANYFVKAKSTCWESSEENSTKLPVEKGKNAEIVAACLGVSPSDPMVDDYSLTFDSDTSMLHVIRNCDAQQICALSTLETCADAVKSSESKYNAKRECIYDLIDFGENSADGTILCKQSESYNYNSNKYGFKTSCKGALEFNGQPCSLSFSSGKLFNLDNGCPVK